MFSSRCKGADSGGPGVTRLDRHRSEMSAMAKMAEKYPLREAFFFARGGFYDILGRIPKPPLLPDLLTKIARGSRLILTAKAPLARKLSFKLHPSLLCP